MDDRLLVASENNARWCALVCGSLGIPGEWRPEFWRSSRPTPRLYPEAVTLRPGVSADALLRCVQLGRGCSIKDSVADVNLARRGFVELFEAQWIYMKPSPDRESAADGWSIVETEDDLAEWTQRAEIDRPVPYRAAARCDRPGMAETLARLSQQLDAEEQAAEVLKRYREPLAAAAFDLHSRCTTSSDWTSLGKYGGDHQHAEEAIRTTLFRLAQYPGWITDGYGPAMMTWADQHRAMGERMIVAKEEGLCMGYAKFRDSWADQCATWDERLRTDVADEAA